MGQFKQRKTAVGIAVLAVLASMSAVGQPTGANVIHGGALLSRQGSNLTVTTTNGPGSHHSAIDWQSFSVPAGSVTRFIQPSTTSLSINRVVGGTQSLIDGTLSSNGKLVLVNPAGIAFGVGSVVDTAGFTASTLSMSDQDALSGVLRFSNGGSAQGITVEGRILAREGDVFLIAPTVQVKEGAVIQGPNGATVLAAGQTVQITGRGLEGIVMEVQAPGDAAVNLGKLEAGAVGMFAGTLRHSGEIRAVTATSEGGRVVLKAAGDATVDGTVTATQGARGGQIDVFGTRVAVQGDAVLDASGEQGGGTIRMGGDYQGGNPDVPNATITYFGPDAQIRADATGDGDGGRIIVWADDTTRSHGSIRARGGSAGGDGGFVEVSGKQNLAFSSLVDTRAPLGRTGMLLLDPANITVVDGGTASADDLLDPTGLVSISPSTLSDLQTDVTLTASNLISFNSPLTLAGYDLTATAGAIDVKAAANITTNGGDVTLTGSSGGVTVTRATISTAGGDITLSGTIVNADGSVGRSLLLLESKLDSGGGNISVSGTGRSVEVLGSAIEAAGGNISLMGSTDLINGVPALDIREFGTTGSRVTTQANGTLTLQGAAAQEIDTGIRIKDGVLQAQAGAITISGLVGKVEIYHTGLVTTDFPKEIINGQGPVTVASTESLSITGQADNLIKTGDLTVEADAIAIGIAIDASTATVTFKPRTATVGMLLGGMTKPGGFNLNNLELDRVTAGRITLGSEAHSGDITIGGSISLAPDKVAALSLKTQGAISANSGVEVAVDSLTLYGRGDISLPGANRVNTLAADYGAGGLSFHNADDLEVEALIGSGNLMLSAQGQLSFNPAVALNASTGSIDISAGTLDLGALNAHDNITLSGESVTVSEVTAGGTLSITAASDLDTRSSPLAGRVVALSSGGDVSVGKITATETLSITAGGSLNQLTASDAALSAPNLSLAVTGPINLANEYNRFDQVTGLSTNNAGIVLREADGLIVGNAVNAGTATVDIATGGDLRMYGAESAPVTASAITLASRGRMSLASNLTATGAISLVATGSAGGTDAIVLASPFGVTITAASLDVTTPLFELARFFPTLQSQTEFRLNVPVVTNNSPLILRSGQKFYAGSGSTPPAAISISRLTQEGAQLLGLATLTITDAFNWTGGNIGLATAFNLGASSLSTITAGIAQMTVAPMTNEGTLTIGGTLILGDALTNTGTIIVNGRLESYGLIDNTGITTVNGVLYSGHTPLSGGPSLRNAVGGRLNVTGNLINLGALINEGTLRFTDAGAMAMTIGGSLSNSGLLLFESSGSIAVLSGSSALTNTGTLRKAGSTGTSDFAFQSVTNTGAIEVEAGTLRFAANAFSTNAGQIALAAGATLSTSDTSMTSSGTLSGFGTLNLGAGTLTNTGTVSPGSTSGIGTLTLEAGQVTFDSGSILNFKLGGATSDRITVVATNPTLYRPNITVNVNEFSLRTQTFYTLQGDGNPMVSYDAASVLPSLVIAEPSRTRLAGAQLRFGSLDLVLPAIPSPTPPPSAPLIPPYIDGPDNPLTPDAPKFTDDDDDDGGGTESLVIDSGLVCLP